MKAWHFIRANKQLGFGDNNIVAPGYTYSVDGEISMCNWGLHASVRALDALGYAPGPIICRVELSGKIIKGDDKVVASERTVLWMADATETLFLFSCDVAEKALNDRRSEGYAIHEDSYKVLEVNRRWIKGKATDAERSVAWSAALSAARSAARSAAESAAESAALSAARSAARSAAESAAESAVWSVALSAAESAAESAAWSVAGSAAWSAAESAEKKWQNKELTKRLKRLEP